jgi:hypothetical protein
MKPFKTLGSLCLAASALFLVTSCTKTVDEQLDRGSREPEQLNGNQQCGNFIGLRMKNPNGYFWYGNENNMQSFNANNFTDKKYVDVSASTNGLDPLINSVAPNFRAPGEHIGVLSNVDAGQENGRINVGEVLTFKLGTDFFPIGFKWYGFDIQVNASKNCVGHVDLYRAGVLVETVNFTGVAAQNSNFSVIHRANDEKWFDEMRFYPTVGAFRLNGAGKNLNNIWLPPVKFYLIYLPNNVFLNTNNNANPFINTVINGVFSPIGDRQLRTQLIPGNSSPNSGEFNNAGTPNTKLWLSLTAPMANQTLTWGSRLAVQSATGVEGNQIQPGEVISIKAGPSLPYTIFRTAEIRVAHNDGSSNPLSITLFRNNVAVSQPTNTNGVNAAYNVFFAAQDFDEVRVTGTGNGAGIGRPGLSIRLYRGCN